MSRQRLILLAKVLFVLLIVICVGLNATRPYKIDKVLVPAQIHSQREKITQNTSDSTLLKSPSLFETNGTVVDCITWETRYHVTSGIQNGRLVRLQLPHDEGEKDSDRKSSFIKIYDTRAWGGAKAQSSDVDPIKYKASGPGSALEKSQSAIGILHTVIERLKLELRKPVIKMLDLPCGDHQYMNYFLSTRDDIEYTGIDIVPSLIEKHRERYKNNPRYTFKQMDIVDNTLLESYDIIICRMMLQHLKTTDAIKALYHFSESGSRFLIATTFPKLHRNNELTFSSFRFRPLNLEAAPINLGPPVCISDEANVPDHSLAMWKLPLVQKT